MLKYLKYAIPAVIAFGGVTGGVLVKSRTTASPNAGANALHEGSPAADAAHPAGAAEAKAEAEQGPEPKKEKKKKEKKPAKDDHGGGHASKGGGHGDGDAASDGSGYVKFSRQFVVPVLDPSGVRSLVVMDINLEVPPSTAESTYAREPKLRDSLLSALLSLSNRGAFDQQLLETRNLDAIRAELLSAARGVIGEDAVNVLILNITRQDV